MPKLLKFKSSLPMRVWCLLHRCGYSHFTHCYHYHGSRKEAVGDCRTPRTIDISRCCRCAKEKTYLSDYPF